MQHGIFQPVGRVLITCATLLFVAALWPGSANSSPGTSHPPHPNTVYAATFEGNSKLYRLEPKSGRIIEVGPTGAQLTDLAFGRKALYGLAFGDLYQLDPATGASTHIGALGVTGANALTVQHASGTLYGASTTGAVFTIDPSSGAATTIGSMGSGLASAGDLAFLNNHLYATVTGPGSSTTLLATIDPATGVATVLGPTGFQNVFGLVASRGHLWGATLGGALVSISKRTGAAQTVWTVGLPVGGLTAPPNQRPVAGTH